MDFQSELVGGKEVFYFMVVSGKGNHSPAEWTIHFLRHISIKKENFFFEKWEKENHMLALTPIYTKDAALALLGFESQIVFTVFPLYERFLSIGYS